MKATLSVVCGLMVLVAGMAHASRTVATTTRQREYDILKRHNDQLNEVLQQQARANGAVQDACAAELERVRASAASNVVKTPCSSVFHPTKRSPILTVTFNGTVYAVSQADLAEFLAAESGVK